MTDKQQIDAQNDSPDNSDSQEETESLEEKQKREKEIMKEQEEKFKSRYANVKGPGPSSFLTKKLTKGPKYFDSGDYYKDQGKSKLQGQILQKPATTGDAIPTPETVPHKKNLNLSGLATS